MADPKGSTLSWRFDAVPLTYSAQLKETWRFRDLFPALFMRSLFLIREKALLGIFWVILRVVAITLPMAFFVGQVLKVDTMQLPASIFILSGFAAWILFRDCALYMMKGLTLHRSLMDRFNIPPLLLVASITSVGLFSFLIVNAILLPTILYHWIATGQFVIAFGTNLLFLIPSAVMLVLVAMGFSAFTSILGYMLADTVYAIRYAFTVWMLSSPVFYSTSIVEPHHRFWFYLNPLTGPIETYRWALFRGETLNWSNVSLSYAIGIVVLVGGIAFFLKMQRRLLDFD